MSPQFRLMNIMIYNQLFMIRLIFVIKYFEVLIL